LTNAGKDYLGDFPEGVKAANNRRNIEIKRTCPAADAVVKMLFYRRLGAEARATSLGPIAFLGIVRVLCD
jgi:hypothetical protein